MKQSLQLKLSQSLTLTPQLQQSIRLLQLSTLEVNQELEQFMAQNPFLERADEVPDLPPANGTPQPTAEPAESAEPEQRAELPPEADLGIGEFPSAGPRRDEDEERDTFSQLAMPEKSLADHLIEQLNLSSLPERERNFAMLVIANIDDDGYLRSSNSELRQWIAEQIPDVDEDDIQLAVLRVQAMDPPGVCARSLAECLSLQLKALPRTQPHRAKALELVASHLELLGGRDFGKLKRELGVDDQALRAIRELIVSLDPRPGAQFGPADARTVVPDVLVRKVGGQWLSFLNPDAVPRLRINRLYADLLARTRDPASKQMSSQLQEARWMLKNVQQRFETILKVTQAIVDRQRNFFDHGEVAMKPLVLREIAEQVGLHESTISRVTTQKYMLTTRGLFELKYFFGSHVATEAGGTCSSTAIRALIKQLVAAEDSKKPLSDNKISDLLADQGIVVARRTVAKYREAMNIQPANLRKSI